MLLVEAIKEKEYIKESILNLYNHIIATSTDSEPTVMDKYMKELDDLYQRYQKFFISIERSKSSAVIKLNETKISLSDAFSIKECMEYKLIVFEEILKGITKSEGNEEGESCIDPDKLFEETEKIRLDIKTIRAEIDHALWQIEAS